RVLPSARLSGATAPGASPARVARADPPQVIERVDARRVSVAPIEMERVLAHRARGRDRDIGIHVLFEDEALSRGLADALGAGAAPAEVSRGVDALVPVGPRHRHALATLLLEGDRGRLFGRERHGLGHLTPPRW